MAIASLGVAVSVILHALTTVPGSTLRMFGGDFGFGELVLSCDHDELALSLARSNSSMHKRVEVVDTLAARMRNGDVSWEVGARASAGTQPLEASESLVGISRDSIPRMDVNAPNPTYALLLFFGENRAAGNPVPFQAFFQSLVAALDDPDRYIAAHYALHRLSRSGGPIQHLEPLRRNGSSFERDLEGLKIVFSAPVPDSAAPPRKSLPGVAKVPMVFWAYSLEGSNKARVDFAQAPSLKHYWMKREVMLTGERVVTASPFVVAGASLLLPALWGLLRIRTALIGNARMKRNQCIRCGYALRDTISSRCPECGSKRPHPQFDAREVERLLAKN